MLAVGEAAAVPGQVAALTTIAAATAAVTGRQAACLQGGCRAAEPRPAVPAPVTAAAAPRRDGAAAAAARAPATAAAPPSVPAPALCCAAAAAASALRWPGCASLRPPPRSHLHSCVPWHCSGARGWLPLGPMGRARWRRHQQPQLRRNTSGLRPSALPGPATASLIRGMRHVRGPPKRHCPPPQARGVTGRRPCPCHRTITT